jgi:PAS domain-containing protein
MGIFLLRRRIEGWSIERSFQHSPFSAQECQWLSPMRQPDFPIVLANDAFLDLTGYTSDELLGRNCRLLQGEGTSSAAVAQIRAAIAQRRDDD